MTRSHRLLADLVDLDPALADDTLRANADEDDRALSVDERAHDLVSRYRRKSDVDSTGESKGEVAASAHRALGGVFSVVGAIAGWGAATALFGYSGEQPVNVVNLIGFFVVLQLLLVLGYVLLALPSHIVRRIPLLGGLQNALQGLSPGFVAPLLRRVLSHKFRAALDDLTNDLSRHRALYGGVARAMALLWSQRFALWFQLGAVAGAVVLTVFSDLAFGWTTTLDVAHEAFHRITSWISWPWSALWPDAVPSAALVESTRFFRLESTTSALGADAQLRTQWWPFVLACLVAYGLAPRIVTWLFAKRAFDRQLRAAIADFPGVRERWATADREHVSTQSPQRTEAANPELEAPPSETLTKLNLGAVHIVDWGGACGSLEQCQRIVDASLSMEPRSFQPAGGNRSSAEDDQVVAVIGEHYRQGDAIMVLVRAWETPTMDLLDFVEALRHATDVKTTICVTILNDTDSEQRGDTSIWQQMLGRLSDPWIRTFPVSIAP